MELHGTALLTLFDQYSDCIIAHGAGSDECKKIEEKYNSEVDAWTDANAAWVAADCYCVENPMAAGCRLEV